MQVTTAADKSTPLIKSSALFVGPVVHGSSGPISGQAMMFQLLLDAFVERGSQVRVFDILERQAEGAKTRTGGELGWRRVVDYLKILPRFWFSLFGNRSTVYITTAQSLWGFARDAAMIWPAALLRHPIIAHQFGANYSRFYQRQRLAVRLMIKWSLSRVSVLVVEGELTREQFSFVPGWQQKVRAIPNGLPERLLDLPQEPKTIGPTRPLAILYLSNLHEQKGYWDVLEAVRILVKDRGRAVTCNFVGRFLPSPDAVRFPDPDMARKEFFNFIEINGLSDLVSHTDSLFGAGKAQAFRAAHIFTLPSNYINEGQPTAVLEAMAYGCVVIATNYRLIPLMVVDRQTGFFVAHGSPVEIADKVEYLLDHPDVYSEMSMNSMQRFEEHFKADRYIERMLKLFEQVSANLR